jgi:hypothetical protein
MFDPVVANFGLLVTLFLGALSLVLLARVSLALSSHRWPVVTGHVHALDYTEGAEYGESTPRVRYRYTFGGRDYEGRRIWLSTKAFFDRSRMIDQLGAVLPERSHSVHVLPTWPSLAVLLPGTSVCDVACLFALSAATLASFVYWT